MTLQIIVHAADEGGFWAEVPALPGCATQGETMDELMRNVADAARGCLQVNIEEELSRRTFPAGERYQVLELAV